MHTVHILVQKILKNPDQSEMISGSINSAIIAVNYTFDPIVAIKAGVLDLIVSMLFKIAHPYIKENFEKHNILERSKFDIKMEDFPKNWGKIYCLSIKKIIIRHSIIIPSKMKLFGEITLMTPLFVAPMLLKKTILNDSENIYKELNKSESLKPFLQEICNSMVISF